MSITIKDIAKIAGVSHTTVSRALNDSPLIKDETKQTIREIAAILEYVPNSSARALVGARSNNIGLFFSSLTLGTSGSFLQEIIASVSKITQNKYNLVINALDTYPNYNAISKENYDGIILVSQNQKDDVFIREMLQKKIPIVVINRNIHDIDAINIVSDDEAGVYDGVSYMIGKGHRQIGLIEGADTLESTKRRRGGYIKALADAQIDLQEHYIVPGDYTTDGGYLAMKKLLGLEMHPKAVFCSNDDMAFGASKAIYEIGLEIPKDVAIMGFDDSLFARYMAPPLTTIKRPISEISSEGIRLLLKLIQGQDIPTHKVYRPSYLVKRQSV